jgi:hypothetical protein
MSVAYIPAVAQKRLSPPETRLAANLQRAFIRSGLNQDDVAAMIPAVDQGQVSKWLAGKNPPSFRHFVALVLAMNASADDLLAGVAHRGADGQIHVEGKPRSRGKPQEPPTVRRKSTG